MSIPLLNTTGTYGNVTRYTPNFPYTFCYYLRERGGDDSFRFQGGPIVYVRTGSVIDEPFHVTANGSSYTFTARYRVTRKIGTFTGIHDLALPGMTATIEGSDGGILYLRPETCSVFPEDTIDDESSVTFTSIEYVSYRNIRVTGDSHVIGDFVTFLALDTVYSLRLVSSKGEFYPTRTDTVVGTGSELQSLLLSTNITGLSVFSNDDGVRLAINDTYVYLFFANTTASVPDRSLIEESNLHAIWLFSFGISFIGITLLLLLAQGVKGRINSSG
jgi:hypothetical protein